MFSEVMKLDLKEGSARDGAKKFLEVVKNVEIPTLTTLTRETFKKRNDMLYTDFRKGRFTAPGDSAQISTFNELLDAAEKILAVAHLAWVWAGFCFRRGASRTQAAKIIEKNLPDLFEQGMKMLKDRGLLKSS